jgi:putative ABC transport system permease protein
MRAVGMSGTQLDKMVLVEAATYSLTGCLSGCVFGIALQRAMITNLMTSFRIIWRFPLTQIVLILMIIMIITVISVIGPLKRVKSRGIPENVNSF